jgi:hypothetical protein
MSFLLLNLSAAAQQQPNILAQQIEQSDSIILISHLTTLNSLQVDSLGKRIPAHKLLVKGKLNNPIVKERVKLSHSQKVDLSSFLPKKRTDNRLELTKCIIFPHHAILFYKKGKISFIDICFMCSRVYASNDLKIEDGEFEDHWWRSLYSYFQKLGFTYEMGTEVE